MAYSRDGQEKKSCDSLPPYELFESVMAITAFSTPKIELH